MKNENGTSEHRPWNDKAFALLDLDAFFASVEQLDHPNWRGKPLIVGNSEGSRGVVATASYEARLFGVHSAMPAMQAKKLCPHAIWTRGNFPRYREMSQKVMSIIALETPYIQQISIDEAFFDISPGRFSKEDPVKIAARIKDRVAELGITCSIGLSNNKTCSKIASNINKPNGLSIIYPGDEQAFLWPRKISDLSGVGKATEKKLLSVGIRSLGDLAQADEEYLYTLLGKTGKTLQRRARGLDKAPLVLDDPVKSVSHERTFPKDLYERDELLRVLWHLAQQVGKRLRSKELTGKTITLKLRYKLHQTHSAQVKMKHPSNNEFELMEYAEQLFDETWIEKQGVRLLGLGVSDFNDTDDQLELSLFEEQAAHDQKKEKQKQLAQLSDKISERFGQGALSFGRGIRFLEKHEESEPK